MKPPPTLKRFKSVARNETPGPGSYRQPSEFGNLESFRQSPKSLMSSYMSKRNGGAPVQAFLKFN